jgi:hypothetical protein
LALSLRSAAGESNSEVSVESADDATASLAWLGDGDNGGRIVNIDDLHGRISRDEAEVARLTKKIKDEQKRHGSDSAITKTDKSYWKRLADLYDQKDRLLESITDGNALLKTLPPPPPASEPLSPAPSPSASLDDFDSLEVQPTAEVANA